jgi:hypothetical protein
MRYVFAALALVMLLFAAVQFNDPDGPLWMLFYGVPAVWAGLAAFRPDLLAGRAARPLLVLSVIAAILLTIAFWPPADEWWLKSVWWESEEAREGMGLMIASMVLLAVLTASVSGRSRQPLPSR